MDFIQEIHLCIQNSSMRDNIINSGGFDEHFGKDKTLDLVGENLYWPQ